MSGNQGVAGFEWVGGDRVFREPDGLVVQAPVDMPYWEVREFRRTAIYFENIRYYITRKQSLGKQGFRYVLRPWPPNDPDPPGKAIYYNERFVAERDASLRHLGVAKVVNFFLFLVYPIIGFLPGGVKHHLNMGYGINDETATFQSIILEVLLVLGIVLTAPAWIMIDELVPVLGVMVLVVLPDAVMRYSKHLSDTDYQFGFYEWLFKNAS